MESELILMKLIQSLVMLNQLNNLPVNEINQFFTPPIFKYVQIVIHIHQIIICINVINMNVYLYLWPLVIYLYLFRYNNSYVASYGYLFVFPGLVIFLSRLLHRPCTLLNENDDRKKTSISQIQCSVERALQMRFLHTAPCIISSVNN